MMMASPLVPSWGCVDVILFLREEKWSTVIFLHTIPFSLQIRPAAKYVSSVVGSKNKNYLLFPSE